MTTIPVEELEAIIRGVYSRASAANVAEAIAEIESLLGVEKPPRPEDFAVPEAFKEEAMAELEKEYGSSRP